MSSSSVPPFKMFQNQQSPPFLHIFSPFPECLKVASLFSAILSPMDDFFLDFFFAMPSAGCLPLLRMASLIEKIAGRLAFSFPSPFLV